MDEDGYFTIVDRIKDMIKTVGENVYPREVEEVLFTHPKVKDAVVVGIPQEFLGEKIKAYIVLKEGDDCHGGRDHPVLQGTAVEVQSPEGSRVPRASSRRRSWARCSGGCSGTKS